jgi:signal transduction histidine kinase
LQELQALTDRLGQEVHHLAIELRPTALDDLGLQSALANYAEEWSARSGVAIDYHSTGPDSERLASAVETTLFRIAQEALTNVLKHAGAKRVSMILHRSAERALLVVEDDGCGFDVAAVPAGRLGLMGMRERLALVGGTLTIESRPGKGTTLFADIALRAEGSGPV